jgi:hypothetical protein
MNSIKEQIAKVELLISIEAKKYIEENLSKRFVSAKKLMETVEEQSPWLRNIINNNRTICMGEIVRVVDLHNSKINKIQKHRESQRNSIGNMFPGLEKLKNAA